MASQEKQTKEMTGKPGPINRLMHTFKDPVNRWKLLIFGLFGCIVVFGGGYGVLSYTNSPAFCSSCHEMTPEYLSFKATAHNQISCVECHTKPGIKEMFKDKLKEFYIHETNVPKQIMQSKKEAVSSQTCLHCHSKNRLVTATGDLKVNHKGHIEQEIPCITCHSGVAHAKIASRGLNMKRDLNNWTKENTKILITEKYQKPNMGTCIDCHDKVNKGQKPWKDISYNLPPNTEYPPYPNINSPYSTDVKEETQTGKEENDLKTQKIILQAIGKQKTNVKLSMECDTCHKRVKIPYSHKSYDWSYNHGSTAVNILPKCLGCHQDSKWIREMPKEDIISLLKTKKQIVKYVPDLAVVKDQSRKNQFCKTCHANRPPTHADSTWLPGHAYAASSSEETEEKCYICHDQKTKNGPNNMKAPATVSCYDCHKYFESGN